MQFTLKSLMLLTAVLMATIAILVQIPFHFLAFIAVPSMLTCLAFLPYLTIRLALILGDPAERNMESVELQRTLQVLMICVFASTPLVATAIAWASMI